MKKIKIIIGSTATGKSDYAVELAKKINGEIISSDSRQIYKGLDIGSGKITKEEMQNIKHYGLDIANLEEKYTAVDWMNYAKEKIEEIYKKDKTPIICGGTGMYIDSLLYGVQDNPKPDYENREILKNKTLEEIQNILKQKNIEYFNTLNNSEKNNKARLIRKLELDNFENTPTENRTPLYEAEIIILERDREDLKKKIEKRLFKRLENEDLINEIKNLIKENEEDQTKKEKRVEWLLSLGLEYKYVTKYLLGLIDHNEMTEKLKTKIYQYAKRQITWNKRYINLKNTKIINLSK